MYQADKSYIQALADGLKISDLSLLDNVMGPNELKAVLKKATLDDFVGKNAWINLHTHSSASDGRQTPTQWLENARQWQTEKNIKQYVIALTDHDCIDGVIEILKKLVLNPKKYQNLKIVLGCELSVAFQNETTCLPLDFEMLHYGLNPFDTTYQQALKKQTDKRKKALPIIFKKFKEHYPNLIGDLKDFKTTRFFNANVKKGLGCNLPYDICSYFTFKNQDGFNDEMHHFVFSLGDKNQALDLWHFAPDLMKIVKAQKFGFTSIAHPYRIQLKGRISDDFLHQHPFDTADCFIENLFNKQADFGVEASELYYGNLNPELQRAFDSVWYHHCIQNDTQGWINIIINRAKGAFKIITGGNDNHYCFLGTKRERLKRESWAKLIQCWQSCQDLIDQGYRILDKEVTMGLPGPCMPAVSNEQDIGIGSPYGLGAKRIWDFWGKSLHKILLGPDGKTTPVTKHSPYVSDVRANPFFIPVEYLNQKGLISNEDLKTVFQYEKTVGKIDFNQVEKTFEMLLKKAHKNANTKKSFDDFTDDLANRIKRQNKYPYIADLQVQIPQSIIEKNEKLFLTDFTLGSPPDSFSDKARNWGFRVLNPKYLWDKKGQLGAGGRLWRDILARAVSGAKGGLRIDHFIGFVNPYVISQNPEIKDGRLYSSYYHPKLGQYAWEDEKDFGKIIETIVLPVLQKAGLSTNDLYPEDIGSRPEQMDEVMARFGLGRLLVAQFKQVNNPTHIYQLMNASQNDIATLDTHDTPSIQMFFGALDDANRYTHAVNLARSLRFNYNDSLKSTEQLVRMQWAELLACPAKRVQAFFTSWTGQIGRYNEPGNPDKWHLRCINDFDKLYFENLGKGLAYNPLDAIALAIYARGDDFYNQHKDFVAQLRQKESELLNCICLWKNNF